MQPHFTPDDVAEAERLNAKLNRLPRLRMQTVFGRLVLNGLLRIAEIYPLLRPANGRPRPELRMVTALDRPINLRIFRPPGQCRGVVLDVHGGGWTIGNARMDDGKNADLAARTGMAVISVDYRLALRVPISAVIDDCEAAAMWVIDNAERRFGCARIAIVGSSAGAHLAAATMLRLRDRHNAAGRIAGMLLYYGLYDFHATGMVRRAGRERLLLHGPTVRATLAKLTPGMTEDERRDPSISPVYADLGGLPPALFVVGANDMLLEDNQNMEARWRAANGNADLLVAPASPHAFDRMGTAIARKVETYTDAWITSRLSASP